MSCKAHSRLIASFIFLCLLWLPNGSASADIGPKPTLEFRFSYPQNQSLSVVSGTLLGCKDDNCLETTSLQDNPYGKLTCQTNTCSGILFNTSHPMLLQVLFSDNQTRMSNPFRASSMRNIFTVKVQDTDLVVSKNVVLSNNAVLGLYMALIPITAAGLVVLAGGLLVSNLLIEHRNRNTLLPFKAIPGRYILAWVLAALALLGGTFLTWALPLTILIEIGVAYLYYRFYWPVRGTVLERHGDAVDIQQHSQNNRPPLLPLLTSVAAVNLITQPLLWGSVVSLNGTFASALSWPIILMEVGVWLAEATLLRILQWRQFKWSDAFQLSFFMNLISCAIGLLLTFVG